jgi:hypothetical protein
MYLDPGFGSMIVQVLIGGVAAGGVLVAMYWSKIKGLFGRNKSDSTLVDNDNE